MRQFIPFTLALLASVACGKLVADKDAAAEVRGQTKKFTFTVKGAFNSDLKTKANDYLYADGRQMTDLWVFDYKDGDLLQQVHQVNTDDDFGIPVLNLSYGAHHVYFVASRGQTPVVDTEDKTIIWSKVYDTFWTDYQVSVVPTSNGNRAVTLERVVTKLKINFTDTVAEGAATIEMTPHTWYYGLDFSSGEPCEAKTDYASSITIPAEKIGQNDVSANLFGFSSTTEWTTDVSISSKTSNGTIIGAAVIEDAPFKRNRITDYSGPLFSTGGEVGITLSTDWLDSTTGTW